jgi:hypothetical protein
MFVLTMAFWLVLGVTGGTIFARKGYSPIAGILAGILFGPIGLIVSLCLPTTTAGDEIAKRNREIECEMKAARASRPCPNFGRENAVTSRFCARCDYRFDQLAGRN